MKAFAQDGYILSTLVGPATADATFDGQQAMDPAWLPETNQIAPTAQTPLQPVTPNPQAAIAVTTFNTTYTQNFDTLSNVAGSTTNNLTIPGWEMTETGGGARDNEQYGVDTGSTTTGDTYSFGAAGATDRALGGLRSGTLIPNFGASFVNNTGGTITSLDVAFAGEQWRLGTAGRADSLSFEYSTDATSITSGTWTSVSALTFTTPDTVTVGAKNGNDATHHVPLSTTITGLNIAPGTVIYVRWTDNDASGADDGLAIDDFSITPHGSVIIPDLTISDVTVAEGNAGTTNATFTVTLSSAATSNVTVNYATADGSATLTNNDYAATSGVLTFVPGGPLTQTITVQINGDLAVEGNETFLVNLSGASANANILDAQGVGTINNDDGLFLSVSNPTVAEGNLGTTSTLSYTVTLSAPAPVGGVTFDIATADGTATVANNDYAARSLTGVTIPEGQTSYTFDVTVNGDNLFESAETVLVNITNPAGASVQNQGVGTITDDDALKIHDIQGDSYYSPLLANSGVHTFNTASSFTVTVQAVVTAIDNNGSRQGFFITEETTDWDGNNNTSEGIFVMTRNDAGTGSLVSGVQVGDIVSVTANIMEYQGFATNLPYTALVNPVFAVNGHTTNIPTLLLDSSHPIPNDTITPVTPDYTDSSDGAGDTFDAANYAMSFFETVEGMLVSIPHLVAADGFVSTSGGEPFFKAYSADHADPSQINSRGGYTVFGDPASSATHTANPNDDVHFGGQPLNDGDINADIVEVDFSGYAGTSPYNSTLLSMGDGLGTLTGVIESDFTDLKFYVTDTTGAVFTDTTLTKETTTLTTTSRQLTFATFNVENLDPTDGAAKFTAIAQAIANNLHSPDILTIEEIQDNNGAAAGDGITSTGTDASTTWQMLVDALNLQTGAHYQWVDELPTYNAEGGEQSGNIRVGFLYNTDRVQLGNLTPDATIAQRRQFTDRIGDGVRDAGDQIQFSDNMLPNGTFNPTDYLTTRKSLLGQFTFEGQTVFAMANHLPSKGGSGEYWQANQTHPANPDNSDWDQRAAIGEDLYTMLNYIQTNSAGGAANIISGGDFNEYWFYRPLETATGYVFADGTPRNDGARLMNLTLNLPEAERYSYTFDGRSQEIDYVMSSQRLAGVSQYDIVHINSGFPTTNRISDHDPALASFDFSSFDEVLTGTTGNDLYDLSQGGNDTVSGGSGDDGFYLGAQLTAADKIDGGAGGFDQVGLQGNYAGLVLGATTITGIEYLALLSGTDTRFGAPGGQSFSYNIITNDANIAAGQSLAVSANTLVAGESVTFNAAAELDGSLVYYGGLGTDVVTGGQQSDGFFFAAGAFGTGDVVDGQGGSLDQLALQGGYSGTFGAGQLLSIESLVLVSANDVRFPGGTAYNYTVTLADGNVASGAPFAVTANTLAVNETLVLNDTAETNAAITVFSGAGNDQIRLGALGDTVFGGAGTDLIFGNGGADQLTGGAGNDTFGYLLVTDSTSAAQDHILDFATGDHIDLSAIASFSLVTGAFTAANQLRVTDQGGGNYLVEAETSGGTAADLSILVISDHALSSADFVGVSGASSNAFHLPEAPIDVAATAGGKFAIGLFASETLPVSVDVAPADALAAYDVHATLNQIEPIVPHFAV